MAKLDFLFCWPLWEAASSVEIIRMLDPGPKSCAIQKQNSGMIMTP